RSGWRVGPRARTPRPGGTRAAGSVRPRPAGPPGCSCLSHTVPDHRTDSTEQTIRPRRRMNGAGYGGTVDAEPVVAVVGYPAAELLDIACLTNAFAYANRLGARPAYKAITVSPGGREIRCVSGLVLQAQQALERLRGPLDTLVVVGGEWHEEAAADPHLVGHVRRLARETRRVASVCTGATILAATGLLDGRRATTHWFFADRLAERYPAVQVDPTPIYIRDGPITTSGGVTSALDLALAFIEEDHGARLARIV